jgi:anti-sigma B factor antagonist
MYTASCETVVTISGELDVVSVRLLEPLLLELIKADDLPMALRLDALTFIDSRGLQGIARLARAARCADSRLIVRSVDSRVVRLLEITGIDQLLCIDVQTRTAIER